MLAHHMHVYIETPRTGVMDGSEPHVVVRNWGQILSSAKAPSALHHVSIPETVNDVKSNKDIEGMKLIANWMKQKTIH